MTEPSLLRRTHLRAGGGGRGEADLDWLDQDLRATSPLTYTMVAILPLVALGAAFGLWITIRALMTSTPSMFGPVLLATAAICLALATAFGTRLGNRFKDQAAYRAARRRRELAATSARS